MITMRTSKASAELSSPGFLRYLALAGLAFLLVAWRASADEGKTLRSISFLGNRAFSSSEIKTWMQSREGGQFFTTDLERIVARYVREGFVLARIDSVTAVSTADSSIDLSIWIQEGKSTLVSSIRLDGVMASLEQEFLLMIQTRAGRPFSVSLLEQDIDRILHWYERNGYPFAKIEIDDISFQERESQLEVFVALTVSEGALAKLTSFRIEGNSSTKREVILRETGFTEGMLFREGEPEKIKRRLERLEIFSSVSMPELYLNADGTAGLFLKVAEGRPNRFDGMIGFVPSSDASGVGYLTGLLNVEFRNLLGTARRLSARWFRESRSTQEVELRYREPWVASYPVNAEGGFFQRKQDSSYVHTQFFLSIDAMIADDWNVGFSFSQSQVFPVEGYGSMIVSRSRRNEVGVSVGYDSRDDATTPTEGFRCRAEYHTGVKEVTGSVPSQTETRSATQRSTIDFEAFVSPASQQVVAVSACARDYRSATIDGSDLYRIGGATTLRGYREGQFLGSRLVWSSLEYRYLVGSRSFLCGFVDAAYIFTPERPQAGLARSEQTKVGYGVGVRLDSPLGLLGVSLALGQGDTFRTAKLHVRLVNEF